MLILFIYIYFVLFVSISLSLSLSDDRSCYIHMHHYVQRFDVCFFSSNISAYI